MSTLPLIPLDDVVVFPGMNLTLAIDVGDEDEVLLVPRKDDAFAAVGTVAEIHDRMQLPGGAKAVTVEGVRRGVAGVASPGVDGALRIEVAPHDDPTERNDDIRAQEREYRAVVEEILDLRNADDRIRAFLRSINEPGALADTAGYSPDLSYEQKVELLEELDVVDRLDLAISFQRERLAEMQVRSRIRDDVQSGAEKQQREYFLRKQMDSIRKELGEDDASAADEYRTRSRSRACPTTSASTPRRSSAGSSGWARAPASPRC